LNLLSEYEEQLDPRIYEIATDEIEKSTKEDEDLNNKSGFSARKVIKRKKTEE